MDAKFEDDSDKCELEEQFLLRLPEKEASKLSRKLKKKSKKLKDALSINLDVEARKGNVKFGKRELQGKLVDLPTVTESYKTTDRIHLFKTAHVSQMLICSKGKKDGAGLQGEEVEGEKTFQFPHGITPPLKNAKKCRFRKTLKNPNDIAETEDVEKEVLLLLRADNEAISSRFEITYDKELNNNDTEINEKMLFGETLSDSGSDDSGASGLNDIMDFTT